jgi:hypothetical protein
MAEAARLRGRRGEVSFNRASLPVCAGLTARSFRAACHVIARGLDVHAGMPGAAASENQPDRNVDRDDARVRPR